MASFFISYNSKDVHWASGIKNWLEQDGHTCIMQAADFVAGSDFVTEMDNALKSTERMIAVISNNYLDSKYCTSEWRTKYIDDPDGEKRLLIPVRIEDCKIDGLLKGRVYIDLAGIHPQDLAKKFSTEMRKTLKGKAPRKKAPGAQKKHSNDTPKARTTQPVADVRPSQTITGDNNVQVGGNYINTQKAYSRSIVQPGPQHITQAQAHQIKMKIDELVAIDRSAGRDNTYSQWWSRFKNKFKLTSYNLLPIEQFDEAMSWCRQSVARSKPKLRRSDNRQWRNMTYKAIYAKAKELGMSKEDVFALANEKLKLKEPISSLKDLGERNLDKLCKIMQRKKA